MADPEWDAKVTAAKAAVTKLGVSDSEAEQAVAIFWSQVPIVLKLLEDAAPPPAEPQRKPLVVAAAVLESDDPADQAELKDLEGKILAVLRKLTPPA